MIIKDSLAPLKQDKRCVSNIYTGGCAARQTIGLKKKMENLHGAHFKIECGWQAAKFLETGHHISLSCVRNMHLGQHICFRLRLLTERSGWRAIFLFFEELGGVSIPEALPSAIAGQSPTFLSKATIFSSKALKPVSIRVSILCSLLRMASETSVWFPSRI